MISKQIEKRKDGRSSASDALRYGEGLAPDRETGELLDKSHRTRFGNFGLIDDGVYAGRELAEMAEMIDLAAIEMQANCEMNTKVSADKKMAHFMVSYGLEKPSEAVLRDTEDSMLASMKLDKNHFATFFHNDNGYWHLHLFASRIEQDPPHRVNSLWHDQINRDKVCRDVEIRHGLQRDNGLHKINEQGEIVEIPREERRAKRAAKPAGISDRARATEKYSGEKSFQTWANDIRIGDRLKHATSWKDLHAAAAAYGCEVKERAAGFVLCPTGEKGGISLSKLGLNKLSAKYGAFEKAAPGDAPGEKWPSLPDAEKEKYEPGPRLENGKTHYAQWKEAKGTFRVIKTDLSNAQREDHALTRQRLRAQHKTELMQIRATTPGSEKFAAISIAKMTQAVALAGLNEQFAQERKSLRAELAKTAPGNTFRDFLVIEAAKGDNIALGLVRRYGVEETTDVLRQREADRLKIVATLSGQDYRPTPRLRISHQVERNGTVVYDFGSGRKITDSAISRKVQLNAAAANSPEAIATALRFATTKFGNTLTLTGTAEFQRLAVETAVSQRLGINFANPELEAYRLKLEAERRTTKRTGRVPDFSHLTPKQIQTGVNHVLARTLDQGRPPEHVLRAEQHRQILKAERGRGVHELPAGGLDAQKPEAGVLLPHPVSGGLGDSQAGQDNDVRRPGASETRSRTRSRADESSADVQQPGDSLLVPPGGGRGRRVRTVVAGGTGEPGARVLVAPPQTPKPIQPIQQLREAVPPAPALTTADRADLARAAKKAARGAQWGGGDSVVVPADTGHQALDPVPIHASAPAPEIDYLDDIHQQIETAKKAAHHNSPLAHSTTTEADPDAPCGGVIVASNEQIVAVQQGQSVKLYQAAELAKRLTYDGLDTGHGRFAVGNKLERKNGKDGMRTLISEEREHMQSEAQRKQGNNHGR